MFSKINSYRVFMFFFYYLFISACAESKLCFIQSFCSNASMEEITQKVPDGLKWIQIYPHYSKKFLSDAVQKAERLGYTAAVLTIDTPWPSCKHNDVRNDFKIPPNLGYV